MSRQLQQGQGSRDGPGQTHRPAQVVSDPVPANGQSGHGPGFPTRVP